MVCHKHTGFALLASGRETQRFVQCKATDFPKWEGGERGETSHLRALLGSGGFIYGMRRPYNTVQPVAVDGSGNVPNIFINKILPYIVFSCVELYRVSSLAFLLVMFMVSSVLHN